jgi:hypothetical protein
MAIPGPAARHGRVAQIDVMNRLTHPLRGHSGTCVKERATSFVVAAGSHHPVIGEIKIALPGLPVPR